VYRHRLGLVSNFLQAVREDAVFEMRSCSLGVRAGDAHQGTRVSHGLFHVSRVQREVRSRSGAGRRQRRHLLHDALSRAARRVDLVVCVSSRISR